MAKQSPLDVSVTKHGEIAVLTMSGGQNRINPLFFKKWMDALDLVESWSDVKALVTTGSGKFYSNGIDLDYLSTASMEDAVDFWKGFLEVRKRILFFPMVTVAAINGHAFAGGMLIAMLHDYRVMQNGRGWMCMNEIDIGLRFSSSLLDIMKTKFSPKMMREITLYGNRFDAKAAFEIDLIDKIADEGRAVQTAVELAKSLIKGRNFGRQILAEMKEDLYGHMIYDDSKQFRNLSKL